MRNPGSVAVSLVQTSARLVGRGARRVGRIGLKAFDVVLGGPGRVTEIDAHNLYNPYSAGYDPESRRMSSGRKR